MPSDGHSHESDNASTGFQDVIDLDATRAYEYALPTAQIATRPSARRDESRLLEVMGQERRHFRFSALVDRLRRGDCLVVNDVAVQPARLSAAKPTGGLVELLVLDGHERQLPAEARCMVRSRRGVPEHLPLRVLSRGEADAAEATATVLQKGQDGVATVRFEGQGGLAELLARYGQPPLPPYIVKRRKSVGMAAYEDADRQRYQTVYADQGAAVAAPTAGLHFTPELLDALAGKGVVLARLRLDVGPGTFQPVRATRLSDHEMHDERYEISASMADLFASTRSAGGRIVAVGTTVVRALEDQMSRHGEVVPGSYSTRIFLKPGHEFSAIDGLVTNFHLPSSTLLALVCAFGGYDPVMSAYHEAVEAGYQFYSYGDAMLVWPTSTPARST